ncbi:hypothetical protein DVH05_007400 [Phytophthora capsici]|nr:hypothetical protein DVH05_007400 [Phytophthora capsici]|eukprot:jgi/Phyca11/565630/estExt2_Genewise1.C_PHYCAscaffold_180532
MEWRDEKEALLAVIRRKEQEATTLAKRFKLLQQTLKEQQKLLDRYQRALSLAQTASKAPSKTSGSSRNIDKTSIKHTYSVKEKKPNNSSASTWMQKKTSEQWALGTEEETTVKVSVEKKAHEEKQEKTKLHAKRKSGSGLAATWAEEKRKMLKKPKWVQNLDVAASGANKENVREEQIKPKDFAYVEVVRNREERKALPAHDCLECTKYYDALGGIGENGAAQKNKCSRHRARYEPYQTPDDFWRLSFPDSEPKSPSML